jgi:hypothetical protein
MFAQRLRVVVTTNGSGAATVVTDPVNGRLFTIVYTKPGSGGFSDGVAIAVTNKATGETIWSQTLGTNASTVVAPRQPTHTTVGAAALYAAAGQAVNDYIAIAGDQLQIAISSGGNDLSGTFDFITG